MSRRASRPLNMAAAAAADAALAAETGGRPLSANSPEDAALRNKWMDEYEKAGGKVEGTKPTGKKGTEEKTPCEKKSVSIDLLSLEFTSDHGLLTASPVDETELYEVTDEDRWLPGGTKFKALDKKEWRRTTKFPDFPHGFPISQTKGTKLKIIAEFEMTPADAKPDHGLVIIDGGPMYLTFLGEGQFVPTNKAKTNAVKIEMEAWEALPELIQMVHKPLKWTVYLDKCDRVFSNSSGPHIIYITFDKPVAEQDASGGGKARFTPEPNGITWRRMHHSVELVEPRDTLGTTTISVFDVTATPQQQDEVLDRPFTVVAKLMELIPGYELNSDPALAAYGHSQYFSDKRKEAGKEGKWRGGAWPIIDFLAAKAECQAIVRMVRNIIKMVGLPGLAEVVFVFAAEAAPHDTLENTSGNGYSGYALVDAHISDEDVASGRVFPPSHTRLADGSASAGFNNFEACMKFTHAGKSLYFGGGAGVYKNKESVILAFYCFIENGSRVEYGRDAEGNIIWGRTIKRVLKRYRDKDGNVL